MEIEIQIGTEKEKEIREKEIINFIDLFGKNYIEKLNIKKIIVSSNFRETVNKLEEVPKIYEPERYMVRCFARVIYGRNGERFIVFSDFWNNFLDQNLRFFYFSHELYHIINEDTLPKIFNNGTAMYQYLKILEKIYDEYSANRFSIDIFKKPLDDMLKDCFELLYDGYFVPLQNPNIFYKPLKKEILKFRVYLIDVNKFLETSSVFIEPIYTYLSYIFAFKDSLSFIEEKFEKSDKILFFNKNTFNLFNKLKTWYESKDIFNFENGLEEVKEFLLTLSISFEDTPEGKLYVNVLDV